MCSNPDCRAPTSGPHTQPDKAINLGVAAHVRAAAPGGKRYNPRMSPEKRGAIENAIWLCQRCAKLVDSDERKYTVGLLGKWKKEHEQRVAKGLKGSSQKIEEVAEGLKRIEFFHDCAKPLLGISAIFTLKQDCTPEQLGHFRFMAEIMNMYDFDPYPTLWVAGRDAYATWHSGKDTRMLIGIQTIAWSRNPDEQIGNTIFGGSSLTAGRLDAGAHLYKHGPYRTLGDLDGQSLSIYMTKPLLEFVLGIYVVANDYVLASADSDSCVTLDMGPLVPWPEPLSEAEASVPWVTVMLKIPNPPSWMIPELARTGWDLKFNHYTPRKRIPE